MLQSFCSINSHLGTCTEHQNFGALYIFPSFQLCFYLSCQFQFLIQEMRSMKMTLFIDKNNVR